MNECIFCKIVAGKIPSYKIYEDENFFAFLDTKPLNPGHTLIIPKEHFRWVWDVPDIGQYFEAVRKIAQAIRKALVTEYVVSLVFGQEVLHAHVWLVPRLANDGHGGAIDLKNIKEISPEEMQSLVEKIKKYL